MKIREILANLKYKGVETNNEIIDAYNNYPQCPKARTPLKECPNDHISCKDCFNMDLTDYMNKS